MFREHRVLMLSVIVTLTGVVVQSAQARRTTSCTGWWTKNETTCPDNSKTACKAEFPKCGTPGDAGCWRDGDNGLILFCDYDL